MLIFGAGGQLGIDLARECRERGHSVVALTRAQVDIRIDPLVEAVIHRHRPDWVINAAAYNDVDRAEDDVENVLQTNAAALQGIARSCQDVSAVLLHYSTDYVFNGKKDQPYDEDQLPTPLSAYGASKVLGEAFASSGCESHYILRAAGVYGTAGRYTSRGNFPESVLRRVSEGDSLRIVDDQVTTPTYGRALASRSLDVLERGIPFGLYHLGGGEPISWFEFARKVLAASGSSGKIDRCSSSDNASAAPRPAYSALSNARIEKEGIAPMAGLDECLQDYMARRRQERPPEC